MATLVLTTVGTLIGGPIGGAIGAVLGQQVDQRLFAPRRQGPRLGELGVQTSSYGQPIARLFGRLRVAGTVIWATDLREERHRSGGGKGRPKTTSYNYSASFAVAISGRSIRGVRRIWADGKLLRGAAGDWKSETGYRLHLGGEAQAIDPLIASAQGIGQTPAHRGLAYAVFEDFQLADYGNRIPSLTFEVEADDRPVSLAAIASELSGGAIRGETAAALRGFAATGDSVRGAIEAMTRAIPVSVVNDGEHLLLSDIAGDALPVSSDETGARADERKAARLTFDRMAAAMLPEEVAVTYYEPERDYQAGLQRARRGGVGRRAERIELPAALSSGEAKAVASRRLAEIWAGRIRATISLPWRRATVRPGQNVQLPGSAGPMRITGWTLDRMALELKLTGVAGAAPTAGAEPGGGVLEPDVPHGQTILTLLDPPSLSAAPATVPTMHVAACGPSPGWRRAALSFSLDGGSSWTDAGATAAPATMGMVETILPPGDSALIDDRSSVDVALFHSAMTLQGCSDAALVNGANAAMIGEELVQFGRADPLGSGRYRLSRLLRGRRGTEWATAGHDIGERFVLLETESLLTIDLPMGAIGGTMEMMANGIGDGMPATAVATVTGAALRPPAPVHLHIERIGADVGIRWTRRSRVGWTWIDGGDAPLGEEQERYRIEIEPSVGSLRTVDVTAASYFYSIAQRQADGATGAESARISVRQYGTAGMSMPVAGQILL